jgi:hypothetical protein
VFDFNGISFLPAIKILFFATGRFLKNEAGLFPFHHLFIANLQFF